MLLVNIIDQECLKLILQQVYARREMKWDETRKRQSGINTDTFQSFTKDFLYF